MSSFSEKILANKASKLFLVRGVSSEKPVWHFILVDELKLALYEKAVAFDSIDLANYGKVLHSGWGENPPEEIVQKLRTQFN